MYLLFVLVSFHESYLTFLFTFIFSFSAGLRIIVELRLTIFLQSVVRAYFARHKYFKFRGALYSIQYSFFRRKRRIRNIGRNVIRTWKLYVRNTHRNRLRIYAKIILQKIKKVKNIILKYLKYLRDRRVRSAQIIMKIYRKHLVYTQSRPGAALRILRDSPLGRFARKWCRSKKLGDWEVVLEKNVCREMRREERLSRLYMALLVVEALERKVRKNKFCRREEIYFIVTFLSENF